MEADIRSGSTANIVAIAHGAVTCFGRVSLSGIYLVGVRETEVESPPLVPLAADAEAAADTKARHGDGDAAFRLGALHRGGFTKTSAKIKRQKQSVCHKRS